jgi:coenzyme F420-reducing hydrogenase beta subunit
MAQNPPAAKEQDEAKIEQQFLKGTKDPDFGVYCDLFSAKSGIEGQDGGVVSALLAAGFREGLLDAAIVVHSKEGYGAEAVVAKSENEVWAAKGTRYLRVNVASKLLELIVQGAKRVAVVCTPCQAKAARSIQRTLKDSGIEVTVIGLFCFEAFNQTKLKEEAKTRLGIDIGKAERTEVRQGKFTATVDGKEYSCRVKDLDSAFESGCRFCDDFTSRFADVSVGSVGSKKGYSTVIVRSAVGERLVKNLGVTKEAVDREEVARLSKFKAERANKSLESKTSTK